MPDHCSRKTNLLSGSLLWIGLLAVTACGESPPPAAGFTAETARQIEAEAWNIQPAAILERVQPPVFPDRDFDVRDYGAQSDFAFDSRPAITDAIAAANAAGGGRVILPAGRWFSDGPLHLKSKVNLHLAEGAVLQFGDDATRYTPLVKVRWEGTVCWNWSPLIYAYRQQNIALTGKGTIDGNGRTWSIEWRKQQKPDKKVLRQMGNDQTPEDTRVFGHGFLDRDGDGQDDGHGDRQIHYLRPTLVEFYECENVLIAGLTLKNSPFWTVHPVFSKNVTVRSLTIYGGYLNDDGIDPDSCEDVLIEDCYVETEDDAVAIKAGRDQDAWERPGCRNILVRNCRLNSGVNAFCVGSEMSGGVENVFVEDCHILYGRHGLNFKCNLDRGGQVQRIFMRNITMDSLRDAMFIFRMDYHGYRGNNYPTKFNDFFAGNIECAKVAGLPFKIVGVEAEPITRVFLRDITIAEAEKPSQLEYAEDILAEGVKVNGRAWSPNGDGMMAPE